MAAEIGDDWTQSPPPDAQAHPALLQRMQSLESLINGALLLHMVFGSLEKLVGTHCQCIPGICNALHRALLILLKESGHIESPPGW